MTAISLLSPSRMSIDGEYIEDHVAGYSSLKVSGRASLEYAITLEHHLELHHSQTSNFGSHHNCIHLRYVCNAKFRFHTNLDQLEFAFLHPDGDIPYFPKAGG